MFKCMVLRLLMEADERTKRMSEQIDSLVVDFKQAFAEMSAALDNVAADEAGLAAQITALTKQLSDAIAAGTISGADLASLTVLRDAAQAMAARTRALADAVPDTSV